MTNIFDLIVKSLIEKDINYLTTIDSKDTLLEYQEKQYLSWVIEYVTRYGETPTIDRLVDEFSIFTLVEEPKNPLMDVFDQTIITLNNRYFTVLLEKNRKDLEKGSVNAYDLMSEFSQHSISGNVSEVIRHDEVWTEYFSDEKTLNFGIPAFDKHTFISLSDVIWFAGRPETFKTTICQWIALQQARMGKHVLVVCNESSIRDFAAKIDCFITGIPLEKFFRNNFTSEERELIVAIKRNFYDLYGGKITYAKGFVQDSKKMRNLIDNFNPDIFFIDGAYLAGDKDGWASFAKLSAEIKQIALDTSTPIIGPLHTGRSNDSGEEVKANDIAGTDNWLRDADKVFGGHLTTASLKGGVTLMNLKNRPIGKHCPPIHAFVNKERNWISFSDSNIKVEV